jgi:hypothetical protein
MDSLITAAGRALSRCEASRWRSSGSSNERRRCGGGLRAGFVRVSCLVVWWDFGGSVRLKSLRENQPIAKSVPQSLP